jgi:hypothetical protein
LVAIIPLQLWGIIQELKQTSADISAGTIGTVLQQATFPYLVPFKTDKQRLVSIFGRMIKWQLF